MLNHTHAKLKVDIRNLEKTTPNQTLKYCPTYEYTRARNLCLNCRAPRHCSCEDSGKHPHAHIVLFRGRIAQWTENVLSRLGENIARQSFSSAGDQGSTNEAGPFHSNATILDFERSLGSDCADTYPFGGGVSNLGIFRRHTGDYPP